MCGLEGGEGQRWGGLLTLSVDTVAIDKWRTQCSNDWSSASHVPLHPKPRDHSLPLTLLLYPHNTSECSWRTSWQETKFDIFSA